MAEKVKISLALMPKLDETKEYEVICASKDFTQLVRFLNKSASLSNVEIISFEKSEYDFTLFCPITGQFVKPGLAGYKLAEYGIKVNVSLEELARIYRYNKEYFIKQVVKMVLSKGYKLEKGCKSFIILAIIRNIELVNYNDYKYVNLNKLNTNSNLVIGVLKRKLFIEKNVNLFFKYDLDLNKYQVRTLLTIFRNIFFNKDKEDIEIDNTDEDAGPILENESFREDKISVYRYIYSCKYGKYKQIIFDCTKLPVKFNGSVGTTNKTVIVNKYLRDGEIIEEKIINSKSYKGGNFLEDFIYDRFKDNRFINIKTNILTKRYNKIINDFTDKEKMLMQLAGTKDIESAKWLVDNGMIDESLPVSLLLNIADELELGNIRKSIEEKIKAGLMPEPDTSIEYFGNQIYFEDEVNSSSEEIDEE